MGIRTKDPFSRSDKLAILALFVGGLSIAFSVWTFSRQNQQWNAINLSRVEVGEPSFVFWAVMSKENAHSTNWGYEVFASPRFENLTAKDEVVIKSRLVPFDSEMNKYLPDLAGLTMTEVNNNLDRRKYPRQNLIIRKHFQIQFPFENVGTTDARETQASIEALFQVPGQWQSGDFGPPGNIAPGKSLVRTIDLYSDLRSPIPKEWPFRIRIKFVNANGDIVEKTRIFYYETEELQWSLQDYFQP